MHTIKLYIIHERNSPTCLSDQLLSIGRHQYKGIHNFHTYDAKNIKAAINIIIMNVTMFTYSWLKLTDKLFFTIVIKQPTNASGTGRLVSRLRSYHSVCT
jgi:hypothetical protein